MISFLAANQPLAAISFSFSCINPFFFHVATLYCGVVAYVPYDGSLFALSAAFLRSTSGKLRKTSL